MAKFTDGNIEIANNATLSSRHYRLSSSGIILDSSNNRTLSANDNGSIVYFTSNTAINVTTSSTLSVGFSCSVIQGNTGQITFVQGANTTMNSYGNLVKTAGQYAMATVISPAANTFIVLGNLV